eukprot:CAMPEP_0176077906 /NCGR_PEP_ID=MMETSP0120_2-20121206/38958_1 /TAXON_ID=160619 /ORGANISM="Kryptoperidinium foliaceum, Strain CCMP 1326" /LENGTH=189 /DNA_ID=CAMNT_0017411649 /DNA_START=163 /DNA_END=733 /DNA_ORIENTATION=-
MVQQWGDPERVGRVAGWGQIGNELVRWFMEGSVRGPSRDDLRRLPAHLRHLQRGLRGGGKAELAVREGGKCSARSREALGWIMSVDEVNAVASVASRSSAAQRKRQRVGGTGGVGVESVDRVETGLGGAAARTERPASAPVHRELRLEAFFAGWDAWAAKRMLSSAVLPGAAASRPPTRTSDVPGVLTT